MDTRYFHNPRCTKSRGALELLRERGIEPEVVHYLDAPPSVREIKQLLAQLGVPARALLRKGEDEYKALGLDDPMKTDEELIAALTDRGRSEVDRCE